MWLLDHQSFSLISLLIPDDIKRSCYAEVRFDAVMIMIFWRFAIAARGPTAVRKESFLLRTQPLSLSARCAPRERTGLTYVAPPALVNSLGKRIALPTLSQP